MDRPTSPLLHRALAPLGVMLLLACGTPPSEVVDGAIERDGAIDRDAGVGLDGATQRDAQISDAGDGGPPAECASPEACPGLDTACQRRTCEAGACGVAASAAGTPCEASMVCDGAGACVACTEPSHCATGVCQANRCVDASCADLVRNGDETDVDCGGSCAGCGNGQPCGDRDDCLSRVCTDGACVACRVDADCAAEDYCDGTACTPRRAAGTPCAGPNQCASGICPAADGVCCDAACEGTCEACRASETGGSDGVCAPILTGTDPAGECTAEDASSCGANGSGCNGSATAPGCNLYPSGTSCAPASCSSGALVGASACDGGGMCVTPAATSCDAYACDAAGVACRTSCTGDTDCATDHACVGGSCISGARSISSGWTSTCAVTTAGGVRCWGSNAGGALGDGTTIDRSTPVDVVGLTDVRQVSVGNGYACALTAGGAVLCWGNNSFGVLGDGTTAGHATPAPVTGLSSGALAIDAGTYHACALMTSGGVKCWGWNSFGQLGDGSRTSYSSTPLDVSGLASGVSAIAAGHEHTCALMSTGGVKCWGYNPYGQLGNGTQAIGWTPRDVVDLSGAVAIGVGRDHSCAATATGVRCWGLNLDRRLGEGVTELHRLTPADVLGAAAGVQSVTLGVYHSCTLEVSGRAQCWGGNSSGQLGIGGSVAAFGTPRDVVGLSSGVLSLDAGSNHTCAVDTTGAAWCWGSNTAAQLGDGTTTRTNAPVRVMGL